MKEDKYKKTLSASIGFDFNQQLYIDPWIISYNDFNFPPSKPATASISLDKQEDEKSFQTSIILKKHKTKSIIIKTV